MEKVYFSSQIWVKCRKLADGSRDNLKKLANEK